MILGTRRYKQKKMPKQTFYDIKRRFPQFLLYLKFLQYDKVIAYLIIIFITVVIIDLISIYARSFFTEKENLKRVSWTEVFIPEFLLSKYKKE